MDALVVLLQDVLIQQSAYLSLLISVSTDPSSFAQSERDLQFAAAVQDSWNLGSLNASSSQHSVTSVGDASPPEPTAFHLQASERPDASAALGRGRRKSLSQVRSKLPRDELSGSGLGHLSMASPRQLSQLKERSDKRRQQGLSSKSTYARQLPGKQYVDHTLESMRTGFDDLDVRVQDIETTVRSLLARSQDRPITGSELDTLRTQVRVALSRSQNVQRQMDADVSEDLDIQLALHQSRMVEALRELRQRQHYGAPPQGSSYTGSSDGKDYADHTHTSAKDPRPAQAHSSKVAAREHKWRALEADILLLQQEIDEVTALQRRRAELRQMRLEKALAKQQELAQRLVDVVDLNQQVVLAVVALSSVNLLDFVAYVFAGGTWWL